MPYSRVERPEDGSATEISIPQTDMVRANEGDVDLRAVLS